MAQPTPSPFSNSPVKTFTPRTTNTELLLADEISKLVHSELGNTQMVTDIQSFFENIIPVPLERVRNIFKSLEDQGYYSNKHWKDLPEETKHDGPESDMYKPFVNIANQISKFVREPHRGWTDQGQIKGRWVDCNATSPESLEVQKSMIRPDCAFVSSQTDEQILEDWRKEDRRMTRGWERKLKGEVDPQEKTRWLQMLVPVEMKRELNTQAVEDALQQLCSYAREIFRNQSDRRFVMGLTLCANSVRIYLFDRSGVLGLSEGINIHDQPLRFVQVLSAFSLLHAEDLGWDITMTIFHRQKCIPSFSFPWGEVSKTEKYVPQWVFNINDNSYIVLRTLNTTDAQVMCGRATLVWEVCELLDFTPERGEIYVLKQSWQRLPGGTTTFPQLERIPFEEFIHEQGGIVTDCLKEGTYVRDRNDTIVSTEKSIRKGVSTNAAPLKKIEPNVQNPTDQTGKAHGSKSKKRSKKSNQQSGLNLQPASNRSSGLTDDQAEALKWKQRSPTAFVDRRLTRILMKRRGKPLKHFKNLEEFVKVFLNAVKMHKKLWDAGILHRDVSPNNMIIRHLSQQTDDEAGDLIDYDHAKVTSVFKTWKEMQNLTGPVDCDKQARKTQVSLANDDMPFSLAATKKILGVVTKNAVSHYLLDMLSRFPSRFPTNKDTEWELEDLGLTEPVSLRPWFKVDVGPGERTGTPAYMSHKLLASSPDVHDTIHDMESFFWILVEHALLYDGPGDSERDMTEELQRLLYNYLDTGAKKPNIFPAGAKYDNALKTLNGELIAKFDHYFKPIEDMIREWWKTLYTAYEFEGFELANIHSHIESILLKTLQDLRKSPPPEHEFTNKEILRRQRLDDAFGRAFEEQRMVQDEELTEDEDIEDVFGSLGINN